ncbi:MAG: hypothetical protein Q8P76_01570 [bacterium]|nr:hypothetical protein [bacterium]
MKNLKSLGINGDEKISDFPKKFNKLLNIIERLIYVVSLIFAILITLILNSVFFEQISYVSNFFNIGWNKLSEGYQLLLLSLPIMIIGGVITHIINKKYIDSLLNRN